MTTILLSIHLPPCKLLSKRNENSVILIRKIDIVKMVKTLFKIELLVVLCRLQVYQKGTFPTNFAFKNFQCNCSFEKMFQKGSERLHVKLLYQSISDCSWIWTQCRLFCNDWARLWVLMCIVHWLYVLIMSHNAF